LPLSFLLPEGMKPLFTEGGRFFPSLFGVMNRWLRTNIPRAGPDWTFSSPSPPPPNAQIAVLFFFLPFSFFLFQSMQAQMTGPFPPIQTELTGGLAADVFSPPPSPFFFFRYFETLRRRFPFFFSLAEGWNAQWLIPFTKRVNHDAFFPPPSLRLILDRIGIMACFLLSCSFFSARRKSAFFSQLLHVLRNVLAGRLL